MERNRAQKQTSMMRATTSNHHRESHRQLPLPSSTNYRPLSQLVVIILLSLLIPGAPARGVLDAHDLAVGDWDVKVRCGSDFYSTLLFPPLRPRNKDDNNDYDKTKRMLSRMVQLPPLPFVQTKSFSCQLSLYPNGTFALRPKDCSSRNDKRNLLSSSSTTSNKLQETKATEDRLLSLQGRWKVNPNPYCITDRFYDELHLQSYPRTLTESQTPPEGQVRKQQSQQRQRLSLQLHCRLCGRYASAGLWRSLRGETDKTARLTRGLLVWNSSSKIKSPQSTKCNIIGKKPHTSAKKTTTESKPMQAAFKRIFRAAPSPLGASFQGKRIVPRHPSSPYEEQEEIDIFGY